MTAPTTAKRGRPVEGATSPRERAQMALIRELHARHFLGMSHPEAIAFLVDVAGFTGPTREDTAYQAFREMVNADVIYESRETALRDRRVWSVQIRKQMSPESALAELRDLCNVVTAEPVREHSDAERLVLAIAARIAFLDVHLDRGGVLPEQWQRPAEGPTAQG